MHIQQKDIFSYTKTILTELELADISFFTVKLYTVLF